MSVIDVITRLIQGQEKSFQMVSIIDLENQDFFIISWID